MITIIPTDEIPQNSDAWLKLRAKYVSATDAYSLLRGKTIQEILLAKSQTNNAFSGGYWADRGHLLEPEAKEIYSAVYQPVQNVGFVINDKYPYVGCSPDGLVNEDGMVEVKCFGEKHHLAAHEKLDRSIYTQIQYQLWVTERKWNTLILYNPDIDNLDKTFFTQTFYPDEKMHAKFEEIFRKETL